MSTNKESVANWVKNQIKQEEIDCYLHDGKDFVDDDYIENLIKEAEAKPTTKEEVEAIIEKAFTIKLMSQEDLAKLVTITDSNLRSLVTKAAKKIKKKVYDNRIVLFAPLYLGSKCVNGCKYCGFNCNNDQVKRRVLTMEEVKQEARVIATKTGHKRLVVVFGEHPETDADYICDAMKAIYSVKEKVRGGEASIRRVNINAAPMSIADLKKLNQAGIGTFQVFQETYHHKIYSEVHPANSLKGNYRWRLYAHHRAMDAGIDDVAIGTLFGLADWRFELLAMVAHAKDLEERFGLGPHTVSVPRLEPATNTDFSWVKHWVNDEDFKYLVAVIRLAIPYAGLIVTNRESPQILHELVDIITQRDADSRLGIGAYNQALLDGEYDNRGLEVAPSGEDIFSTPDNQNTNQQFQLGDTRCLDAIIRELAKSGHIVSFCTAGYRCGRTGKKIMKLLETGVEGCFCKLNAILTFREWLDDFGSKETQKIGQAIIDKELEEVKSRIGSDYSQVLYDNFMASYNKIVEGKRDLYF